MQYIDIVMSTILIGKLCWSTNSASNLELGWVLIRVCVRCFSLSPVSLYSNPTTAAVTTTTTAIAKLNGGQTTPLDVSGLSQCEIQGLLLGAHPSAVSPGSVVVPASSPSLDQQQQQQQHHHHHHQHMTHNEGLLSQGSGSNLPIKREPEDLRKDPSKGPSRSHKVISMLTNWPAVHNNFSGPETPFRMKNSRNFHTHLQSSPSHCDISNVQVMSVVLWATTEDVDNGQSLSFRLGQTTLSCAFILL